MPRIKEKGLYTHRFKDNPDERKFAKEWDKKCNSPFAGNLLKYLLSPKHHKLAELEQPSDRDRTVAATIIQWLGSPVGQNFLETCGFSKRRNSKSKSNTMPRKNDNQDVVKMTVQKDQKKDHVMFIAKVPGQQGGIETYHFRIPKSDALIVASKILNISIK